MKKFTYQATQKLYALIVGIIFLLILFGQWCSFKLKKGFLNSKYCNFRGNYFSWSIRILLAI